MSPRPVTVLGIRIDLAGRDEILEAIAASMVSRRRLVITPPHFWTLLQAREEPWLVDFLNGCQINHADGAGVALAIRALTGIRAARVNGTDLYAHLLERMPPGAVRYYFLGGDEETAHLLLHNVEAEFFGTGHVHARHGRDPVDDRAATDDINAAKPDILLVGMGSPKQFAWIARWKDEIDVPVILAVGGGLEFLSGRKRRAPHWMRAIGLEWLHRLLLEPGRLWKRYLLGIPRFVWAVWRERRSAPTK